MTDHEQQRPADAGHGEALIEVQQQPADAGPLTVVEQQQPGGPGPGTVVLARPPVTRKLDLACGQTVPAGFEGVDIWPGAQHVVDLQKYPWPFEDASVLEIRCNHYIEHIPMEMVAPTVGCPDCKGEGLVSAYLVSCFNCKGSGRVPAGTTKDALFAFFDECWRILVPDGWLHVTWPSHRSDRAFQDPTHRRFPTAQTMCYMSEQWRRDNRLDHYNVECNFQGDCNPIVDAALNLRHPEAAQKLMSQSWNTTIDWTAKMQKKPRLPPVK